MTNEPNVVEIEPQLGIQTNNPNLSKGSILVDRHSKTIRPSSDIFIGNGRQIKEPQKCSFSE